MVRWRCFVHLSLIFETPICATFTVNIYFTCFLYILTHVTIGELDVACSTDDYCWLVSVTLQLTSIHYQSCPLSTMPGDLYIKFALILN